MADSFQPDSFEADATAQESRKPVSVGESVGRGAAQGATFGFGDEIQGVIQAAVRKLVEDDPETFAALYRKERDIARSVDDRAAGDNPKAFVGGTVLGALPSTAVPIGTAPRGASVLARSVAGAKASAPVAGLASVGASEADSIGGLGKDVGIGLAGGTLLGAAVPVLGSAVSAAAGKAAPKVREFAIEQGRKALSGIGTPLSARKPISAEAVQQAIDSGAIKPFGTVTGTAERLGAQADEMGARYGQILTDLEAAGVKGPNAILLARQLMQEAAAAERVSLASPRPGMFRKAAEELTTKVPGTPFADKRLGLMQAEEIKRGLQREANYSRLTDTATSEAKKDLASTMRGAIEDAIDSQASRAPVPAAEFEPVKRALSRTLEAEKAAAEGAARAARRKPISLSSTIVGGAAGASAGPLAGLGAALGHGLIDSRLASTNARAGDVLASALAKIAKGSTVASKGTAQLTAEELSLLDALGLRVRPAIATGEAGDTR